MLCSFVLDIKQARTKRQTKKPNELEKQQYVPITTEHISTIQQVGTFEQ